MKGMLKSALVVGLVAVVASVGVVAASAQGEGPGPGDREGPLGQRPIWGPGSHMGPLSDYADIVHEAVAEALGMTQSAFEQAIADGETLFSLAQEKDLDLDELREIMLEARAEAVEQALADGAITEEQAEWLQSRPRGPMGGIGGGAECDGSGPRGMRSGRRGGPGF